MYSFFYPVEIISVNLFTERSYIIVVKVGEAFLCHICTALCTVARSFTDDIKENFARIINLHNLFNFRNKLIKIACVKTHIMISCFEEISVYISVIFFSVQPFGMSNRILLVITCRNINRSLDADFCTGIKLSLK